MKNVKGITSQAKSLHVQSLIPSIFLAKAIHLFLAIVEFLSR
jgi:hypothetical protein